MPNIPAEDRYPGVLLKRGSSGPDVKKMQNYLNFIGKTYSSIPPVVEDGKFGPATETAVIRFQQLFGLVDDGIIGPETWNAIVSAYYELKESPTDPDLYPGFALKRGDRGSEVSLLQSYLDFIAKSDPELPSLQVDGRFGAAMERAVEAFQRQGDLLVTGIVDENTWNAVIARKNELNTDPWKYPGAPLRFGSTGIHVVTVQNALNQLRTQDPSIPRLVVDGRYGIAVEEAVAAFQRKNRLEPDGITGPRTWYALRDAQSPPEGQAPEPHGASADSYPGVPLSLGSRGEAVRKMQSELSRISRYYPSIPALSPDGVFGTDMERSVLTFQQILGLRADGIIGRDTWETAIRTRKELEEEPVPRPEAQISDEYPGAPLMEGSIGPAVTLLQTRLNEIGDYYQSIPRLAEDGKFGVNTRRAVLLFQRIFGLTPDGMAGPKTWEKVMEVRNQVKK